MKKIAVIAAHPDDEILGCGATVARHALEGDAVSTLIMAEGIASRGAGDLDGLQKSLYAAAQRASQIVGARNLEFCQMPDNQMDGLAMLDIVQKVEAFLNDAKPDIIYTHFPYDLNIDHQLVSKAVLTAARPLPESNVSTILYFEVPSSTGWAGEPAGRGFEPNWFVDIGSTLDKKLDALLAYQMEMRPFPHARSIEAVKHLAHWRGAAVGVRAAEAFVLARHLSRKRNPR